MVVQAAGDESFSGLVVCQLHDVLLEWEELVDNVDMHRLGNVAHADNVALGYGDVVTLVDQEVLDGVFEFVCGKDLPVVLPYIPNLHYLILASTNKVIRLRLNIVMATMQEVDLLDVISMSSSNSENTLILHNTPILNGSLIGSSHKFSLRIGKIK